MEPEPYRVTEACDWRACGITGHGTIVAPAHHWGYMHIGGRYIRMGWFIGGVN